MRVFGLLLAAGLSRRFGAADKLCAPFEGRPLVAHAADVLRGLDLAGRLAVTSAPEVTASLHGFAIVSNPDPAAGQGASLARGARAARARGADRLLVLLGDAPLVTRAQGRAVIAACTEARPAASVAGGTVSPPACFPASWLDRLAALDGDRGAGALLRGLPPGALVPAPSGTLADADTPDALAALRRTRTPIRARGRAA